jgi:hypothetical protein
MRSGLSLNCSLQALKKSISFKILRLSLGVACAVGFDKREVSDVVVFDDCRESTRCHQTKMSTKKVKLKNIKVLLFGRI